MPNVNTFNLIFILYSISIIHRVESLSSDSASCQLSLSKSNKLYEFVLVSPVPGFPHGVRSEDGFYKVAANETLIWFQLCEGMIFNHDPPQCVNCLDCGGPSRCGMECSALAAKNIEGYDVCTTIGRVSSASINLIDNQNPSKGVVVKMSSSGSKHNCSLSVSVICNSEKVNVSKKINGPHSLEKLGTCDYATVLEHPSGCATITSVGGSGWGWFSTFIITITCLFGAYVLAGAVYRYSFIGVRGLDIIPHLDFWATIPQRTQSLFASLIRKFRGPSEGYRSSYSRVNF